MQILVTNDDGVNAPGIRALAAELKNLGDVTIAAPAVQKSAISSSITLYTPLLAQRRRESGFDIIAVEGTPADAVKLAIRELLPEPPDVVVSGINFGLNTGSNILYSGTVGAALEGALFSIPSFAVSLEVSDDPRWSSASRISRQLIAKILRRYPKDAMAFNINLPARTASRIRGTLVTVQEALPYEDSYDRRQDPRGRTYYWLKGTPERKYNPDLTRNGEADVPTDAWAVSQGYVSVTPLRRNLTHESMIDETKRLLK
jgi:5'-nucleotidase